MMSNPITSPLVEDINNTKDDQYTTIRAVSRTEFRVKKSRFIGLAKSVATEREAMDFIRNAKAEFPKATHYCYAFSIGFGAKRLVRSSDSGEPANSASRPILSAIESSGFHNVICIVVRYFGGIKLGIGGLIRAYGQTARDCLNNAETVVYIPSIRLQIEMPYAHIGAVVSTVNRFKGEILSMNYDEKTKVVVRIKRSMVPPLKQRIRAISGDIKVRGSYCEIHQNT